MRALSTALLLGVLLTAAGCGGDDDPKAGSTPSASASTSPTTPTTPSRAPRAADAPTVADIAKALIATQSGSPEETYTATEATCVAEVLHSSQLSDASLELIAKDLSTFVPSGAEETAFRAVIPLVTACVAGRLNTPSPSPQG